MIRFATQEDINKLKNLWDDSFHDPMSFVDFLYDNVVTIADTLVVEQGEDIACMLTIIPTSFVFRDKAVKTAYIYGAATAKKYQRKGYMTHLLTFAEEYCRDHGYAMSVLVPGEKYLFGYYKKRGYSEDFNCRMVNLSPGMINKDLHCDTEILMDDVPARTVHTIREDALCDIPHIAWSAGEMTFALKDCRLYDEHVAYYKGGFGESYCIYGMDGSSMFIKECLGSSVDAQQVLLKQVLLNEKPRRATLQLPIDSELFRYEGERARFGMAKPLVLNSYIRDLDAYMNLMLD